MHLICRNRADSSFMRSRPAARQASAQANNQCQPAVSAACSADKAWRQRFVHKWCREQARPCKICSDDLCDDPWHAALHMLQAANVHPDLQMPMPDHDCYPVGASPSPLLSIDDDLHCVLETDGITPEPAEAVSATTKIQSALSETACRARQLLKHQVPLCLCLDNSIHHHVVCSLEDYRAIENAFGYCKCIAFAGQMFLQMLSCKSQMTILAGLHNY